MSTQACLEPAQDETRSAREMPLVSSTAFVFGARALEYFLAGLTGIILARGLGPEGRGLISLISETGNLVFAPVGLGIASAGVYYLGQRRYSQQVLFSNAITWALAFASIYMAVTVLVLSKDDELLGMNRQEIAMAVMGGAMMFVAATMNEFLLARGRVGAYTLVQIIVPSLRFAGVVIAAAIGLTVLNAAWAWLLAITGGLALSAILISRQVRLAPGIKFRPLWAQISFGARGHLGWILQVINHRLDVFIVGYFVSTAAVGFYVVAFNMAELAWWFPLALGTILFPKVSAMDAASNARLSAAACRRTLAFTLLAIFGMLILGQVLIITLYGSEFAESLTAYYILLPSGLFYTIHKVLGTSLSGQGMPQASFYGGLISVPAMIALDLLLIPRYELVGAAVASDVAYGLNAAVMLGLFVWKTRIPIREVLLFNRADFADCVAGASSVVRSISMRISRPTPQPTEEAPLNQ